MAFQPVIVVTGAGGMGLAAAQRLGAGKKILLADFSEDILKTASAELKLRGHTEVHIQTIDVSDPKSVAELAVAAKELGIVETVIHAAGVPPTKQAADIYNVNLIGTALVIDAFQSIIATGGSMVCIASLTGHLLPPFSAEDATHFGLCRAGPELLRSSSIDAERDTGMQAYMTSKAANIYRVKTMAPLFGSRGVRLNSISPGLVATPMTHSEMAGPGGDQIKAMILGQPIKRVGTVDDIAEAVAFLASAGANWITGTDLIVDGGAHSKRTREGAEQIGNLNSKSAWGDARATKSAAT